MTKEQDKRVIPTPTNMSNQERRDSELEIKIKIHWEDIRNMKSGLISAQNIKCISSRNVITNLFRILISRTSEKIRQLMPLFLKIAKNHLNGAFRADFGLFEP